MPSKKKFLEGIRLWFMDILHGELRRVAFMAVSGH